MVADANTRSGSLLVDYESLRNVAHLEHGLESHHPARFCDLFSERPFQPDLFRDPPRSVLLRLLRVQVDGINRFPPLVKRTCVSTESQEMQREWSRTV